MKIKIVATALAVCLGAAACDQGERQVADAGDGAAGTTQSQDRSDVLGQDRGGASTPAAAGRPTPNAATDRPTTGASADADDPDQSEAANAVQDAAAGITGQVNAAVVGGDTEAFLRNAALGAMYEIQASEMALDRSASAAVREIAQTIINDHRRMSADLKATASRANVAFMAPAALDDRRKGLIDNLEAASAEDFDDVFLEQQESAHDEALLLLHAYADRGDVPALQAAAQSAIPTVEARLDAVKAAQDALDSAG